MAHFARLNEDNVVINVIVVNDKDTDEDGVEDEATGKALLESRYPGATFIQTSYNNNIRTRFASIGMTYYPDIDAFVHESPYPSWVLDPVEKKFVAPITDPSTYADEYRWNEDGQEWVAQPLPE